MSTAPTKQQWMAYLPDNTDEGALGRRLANREPHLGRMKSLRESGIIKTGSAVMTQESALRGNEKKMVGSLLIIEAETIEDVKKVIEDDLFWSANVWNKDAIVILPFIQPVV